MTVNCFALNSFASQHTPGLSHKIEYHQWGVDLGAMMRFLKKYSIPHLVMPILAVVVCSLLLARSVMAQADSVAVRFLYQPVGSPSVVYLPGEFNGWGANVNGRITDPRFVMQYNAAAGLWEKTVRLRVGGPVPLPDPGHSIAGAYQYKFNENGSADGWKNDPLNFHINPRDHDNSYLYANDPTILHLAPNASSSVVETSRPEISAAIFPAIGAAVDTASITLFIDKKIYANLGRFYDAQGKIFSYPLPDDLPAGQHDLKLFVTSSSGSISADSTMFITKSGFIQLLTRSDPKYLRPQKTIEGIVEDASVTSAQIVHNGMSKEIPVTDGKFSTDVDLEEGENTIYVNAVDALGVTHSTNEISIFYYIDHSPKPAIRVSRDVNRIVMRAEIEEADVDPLSYSWWTDNSQNPESLSVSSIASEIDVPLPQARGDYNVYLDVADSQGNNGTAGACFSILPNDSLEIIDTANNPAWVQDAVVYEIFVLTFSPEGTLNAIREKLPYIKSLGANVLWFMPIFENSQSIDDVNAGYNVTDFYQVHPQYGSQDDFDELVAEAHKMGIKIVLDFTPNHVSANHPWVSDIALFQNYSIYRPLIEIRLLGDNRGLGQSLTYKADYPLYAHYSNWTLANLNYANLETRTEMLNLFTWWLLERHIDGFRMDVYWGPNNRYGRSVWWEPFRQEIKRIRPNVLVLGETDGTGVGSENNYASHGGGCDAAYDWNFFNQATSMYSGGSVSDLDNRVRNYSPTTDYNFYTGSHTHYFRFLENHDTPRIAYWVGRDRSKAAAALLMTIPGIPLVYAGQEIGETSQRGKINWGALAADEMFAYYQRLIHIRERFDAFRSAKIKKITTNQPAVYAYLRPFQDLNSIVAINFSQQIIETSLNIASSDLQLSSQLSLNKMYYLNDILNNESIQVSATDLENFTTRLEPWTARIFIFSDSLIQFQTGVENRAEDKVITRSLSFPSYPNPFNPSTTIRYTVSSDIGKNVSLKIYNLLGKEIKELVNAVQQCGSYQALWNGTDSLGRRVPSGIYLYRLKIGEEVFTRKMTLLH
jgi:cyclomaltodextrinase